MASKFHDSVSDHNFTALVARMWRNIRTLPFQSVRRMNGRYGLIGVIRAIYQANRLDHESIDDFRALMHDASNLLDALRAAGRPVDPDEETASPPPVDNATVLEVLTALDPVSAQEATDAIERLATEHVDAIEVSDDDETPPPPPKKDDKDKGGRGGGASGSSKSASGSSKSASGSSKSAHKRKSSGGTKDSSPKKQKQTR